jgi:hypothetical protein
LKERWNRDKRLDLNTATKEQLMVLPGMTAPEADKVIAGRPYENAGELVMRGIPPKNEYDKIADGVTANIWRAELCLAGQAEDCTTHDTAKSTERAICI